MPASEVEVGDVVDLTRGAPTRLRDGFGTVVHRHQLLDSRAGVELHVDLPGFGRSYSTRAAWDRVVRRRRCPHGCDT